MILIILCLVLHNGSYQSINLSEVWPQKLIMQTIFFKEMIVLEFNSNTNIENEEIFIYVQMLTCYDSFKYFYVELKGINKEMNIVFLWTKACLKKRWHLKLFNWIWTVIRSKKENPLDWSILSSVASLIVKWICYFYY